MRLSYSDYLQANFQKHNIRTETFNHHQLKGKIMPNVLYDWKRFWCPRTGNLNLSDHGFLYDPDSEYGRMYNNDVKSFSEISNTPCLALLGEPGIGKSQAIQSEIEALKQASPGAESTLLQLDLRSYSSEDRLIRNLFESHKFKAWLGADYVLHLFLDSLDECLMRVETIATLLIDELKNYPVQRLNLRIACRTAEWPLTLEKGLMDLWGEDNYEAYELTPLRRLDVSTAATKNDIDPDQFINEIFDKEVISFAIKPVTLQFLLNIFKKGNKLPLSQYKLYFSGCLKLSEEQNQQRIDGKLAGIFSSRQRLAVAARIAAITQYTNRYAIWKGIDTGDVPDEDVTVTALTGGKEIVDGVAFEVTERAVRETLDTGLFSSRGPNRMGWAHQTYAEFLAAIFVVQNKMVLPQIKSLIWHPSDPDNKLVPQLHETAGWLSAIVPGVFTLIMQSDPEVLLRSDAGKAGNKERQTLIAALLTKIEDKKFFPRSLSKPQYKNLSHPNLVRQLRVAIKGSKNYWTRITAIDIAEACMARDLQNFLFDLVVDSGEVMAVRIKASHAISIIADDEIKTKMLPFAKGTAGDDPDDELKGNALFSLWPELITSADLFESLTPPKNENLFGAYNGFVVYELEEKLSLCGRELIPALRWVEQQKAIYEMSYNFRGLVDSIILKAWDECYDQDVLHHLVAVFRSRLAKHDYLHYNDKKGIFEKIKNDPDRRHLVLLGLISSIDYNHSYVLSSSPFVLNEDFEWLLDEFLKLNEVEAKKKVASLLRCLFRLYDESHFEAVLSKCKVDTILLEQFSWFVNPVILGSADAKKMKKDYYQSLKWQEGIPKKKPIQPPPKERIARCLDRFEKGDLTGWWALNLEMTLEPNSTHYGIGLEPDLTKLPGWTAADELTRTRIIEAAKRYVIDQDPKPSEWVLKNQSFEPDFAGYRAFDLLLAFCEPFLCGLNDAIWKKWAIVLVAYPTDSEERKTQKKLVELAYLNAAGEVIDAISQIIDKENVEHDFIFITQLITDIWDTKIEKLLMDKAVDPKTKAQNLGCHLGVLLEHNSSNAYKFAESLIISPIPYKGNKRNKAIIAAKVLLQCNTTIAWPIVWKVFRRNRKFGKEVLLEAANGQPFGTLGIQSILMEQQLTDIYIYIAKLFPHKEDVKPNGSHFVSSTDNVSRFRDNILSQLQQRGTNEACECLQKIIKAFPDLEWLRIVLHDAKILVRRKSWQPLTPTDILHLASNYEARVVQSGLDLLEVLVQSFQELEQELHGETPAVIDLWNERPESKKKSLYSPKDENRFSDYVKRFLDKRLRQRGVIINREVEIRRGTGATKGERTDIHVDAVTFDTVRDEYDRISVVLETKGCWNPGLLTDMENQLAKRYLKRNASGCGLFLVGWFNCSQWDDNDYRKKKVPKLSLEEARSLFKNQATALSVGDLIIGSVVLNTALI